ncbi:MAG: tol-pal system protein YbgF [Caulobacterales bacterium]
MKLKSSFGHFAAALCGVLFAALVAGHAMAQTPMDEPLDDHSAKRLDRIEKVVGELRAIVYQGRETGKPVVIEPADTDSQLSGLTQRISDLEQSLTKLNGQIETLSHAVDEARRESDGLREENGALSARVTALEAKVTQLAAPPPPQLPPEVAAPGPAVDPAATIYGSARQAYATGDFAMAETGFKAFVDQYGDGPRGPEARYWLGKSLLARRAYTDAASAFIGAIRGWPQTLWAPDAVLGLSNSLIGLKQLDNACQTLGELARRYPKANAEVRSGAAAARAEAQCPA